MFRDEATFDVDELKEIFGHLVNSPTGKRSRVLHSYIDVKDTSSFFSSQQWAALPRRRNGVQTTCELEVGL